MKNTKYCLNTIRKKAYAAGYRIEKGFQHYTVTGRIFTNYCGEHFTGYNVWDLATGQLVYESGCYDGNSYDHLCTLEDVEDFLKSVYEKAGLKY